ncbi:MAG: hypothetical protein Q4B28_04255 [bacterium]|nr:hypothetical protein [bacterium]
MREDFVAIFEGIWNAVQDARTKIEPILIPIWEMFATVVTEVLGIVLQIVGSTFQSIALYIQSGIQTFGEIIDFLKNVFTGNWD